MFFIIYVFIRYVEIFARMFDNTTLKEPYDSNA